MEAVDLALEPLLRIPLFVGGTARAETVHVLMKVAVARLEFVEFGVGIFVHFVSFFIY